MYYQAGLLSSQQDHAQNTAVGAADDEPTFELILNEEDFVNMCMSNDDPPVCIINFNTHSKKYFHLTYNVCFLPNRLLMIQ